MGLECERRHARKRWAEDLGILKKTSVFGVDFGPCKSDNFLCHLGHRELNSLPWRRQFGVDFGPCNTGDFVSAICGIEN